MLIGLDGRRKAASSTGRQVAVTSCTKLKWDGSGTHTVHLEQDEPVPALDEPRQVGFSHRLLGVAEDEAERRSFWDRAERAQEVTRLKTQCARATCHWTPHARFIVFR